MDRRCIAGWRRAEMSDAPSVADLRRLTSMCSRNHSSIHSTHLLSSIGLVHGRSQTRGLRDVCDHHRRHYLPPSTTQVSSTLATTVAGRQLSPVPATTGDNLSPSTSTAVWTLSRPHRRRSRRRHKLSAVPVPATFCRLSPVWTRLYSTVN